MSRQQCPNCERLLVPPAGPPKSPILLVGEFPGYYEIQQGIPFVGPAGDILRQELARVSISYDTCRVANLWQHAKTEKDEKEVNWHLGQLVKEMKGRRFVLLMGSDCALVFAGGGVMEYSGLEIKSPLIPPGVEVCMISPNPAQLIHGTVGEFRLALEKFARRVL